MKLLIPAYSRKDADFPGEWTLYKLQETGKTSFLWQRFKLMLPPKRPAKRSQSRAFYVTWNPDEQRFAKDAPLARLQRDLPDLYAMLELHMSLNYGPDWLTDRDGGCVTQAEIDQERARLKMQRLAAQQRRRAAANP